MYNTKYIIHHDIESRIFVLGVHGALKDTNLMAA